MAEEAKIGDILCSVTGYYALIRKVHFLALKDGESLFSFILDVRRGGFDVLIDLHNNLRSNLVCLFSGVPQIIRYRKAAWERRLFVKRRISSPELKRSTIDRYLDTLKDLGMEPQFFAPEIHAGKSPGSALKSLKILIIQTAYLGDAVLTTPMFEALRTVYPSSRISLLCIPEIKDIFSGNRSLDEILVMDKRGKEGGLFSLLGWGKKLKGQFDVALIPHRSFRSSFLAWLAGIPKRVGFDNSQGRIFLTDRVHFNWKTHDAERNMKLLEVLGVRDAAPEMVVPLEGSTESLDKILGSYGIRKGSILVGMNPGSVWNTKKWLPEGFARVADALIAEWDCEVLLFGSARDSGSVGEVTRRMKRRAVDLCGKTDLKGLAALISRCSLFVTNDSGPMHLATAAGVPVVAIFGPTTRELGFFPYGRKSVVVEVDLPCRPCTLHGGDLCPLDHFRCMKEVTPDMVLKPCRDFLSQAQASKSKGPKSAV
jgi:heptosyltransferase-2